MRNSHKIVCKLYTMACFLINIHDTAITILDAESNDSITVHVMVVRVCSISWAVLHRYNDFVELHGLWDTVKSPLWSYINQVSWSICVIKNYNFCMTFSETVPHWILRTSVQRYRRSYSRHAHYFHMWHSILMLQRMPKNPYMTISKVNFHMAHYDWNWNLGRQLHWAESFSRIKQLLSY
jgi:hypothetical protein